MIGADRLILELTCLKVDLTAGSVNDASADLTIWILDFSSESEDL